MAIISYWVVDCLLDTFYLNSEFGHLVIGQVNRWFNCRAITLSYRLIKFKKDPIRGVFLS
jgi:hypothetical protein